MKFARHCVSRAAIHHAPPGVHHTGGTNNLHRQVSAMKGICMSGTWFGPDFAPLAPSSAPLQQAAAASVCKTSADTQSLSVELRRSDNMAKGLSFKFRLRVCRELQNCHLNESFQCGEKQKKKKPKTPRHLHISDSLNAQSGFLKQMEIYGTIES